MQRPGEEQEAQHALHQRVVELDLKKRLPHGGPQVQRRKERIERERAEGRDQGDQDEADALRQA